MNNKKLAIVYVSLFAILVVAFYYLFFGTPLMTPAPLFVGGSVLWLLTTYSTPIDARKIIIPYLLTVILFIVHVYEEYTAFVYGYPDILGGVTALDLKTLLTFAAFLSPILWLSGAVMLLMRWSVGYFVVSTFLFGMMFIEPLHFIAPFLQKGGGFQYVGGLWTAILPTVVGWYVFFIIRRETKKEKQEHAEIPE
jgi:hypothetical protein